jgi:hypothetical protein
VPPAIQRVLALRAELDASRARLRVEFRFFEGHGYSFAFRVAAEPVAGVSRAFIRRIFFEGAAAIAVAQQFLSRSAMTFWPMHPYLP